MTDRTVVYRIQADVAQAKAQVAALGASVKKSADDMTAATKEGAKFRGGLDSLGGAAGKVGLVAAVGLGAAVKKAADFDAAMSNVQAATHESAAAMDSLREAALEAGAKTAFSATEAAAGIENLAKAGVTTADILGGGLAGALDLAAAGEMDVASAAEAAAGAMAQFKLEGDQVPHIADLMAAAAGKAQGEVSDMVMALKQGGTVAAQTGLSLEETTGALAAMAEQSLLGSDAGTSFKTMLGSLTPNSKKAADAMEQYNIHAFDAQGNFVGMTELAGQLRAGLGGLTDEQRAMALETIFGSDAVRAASIIYDNGAEGIANWTEKVNDAGYAAETAAIKQDNLRGDIEKLGGSLETALIGTGDGAQGPLRSLVQSLEGVVNAYNDLGSGAKSGVGVMLAATATIGGGLFVFSKTVQSISDTRQALKDLGATATGAQGALANVGKALSVVGIAIAAQELTHDLGDVDYSVDSLNRQLTLMAAQGEAAGVLEDLSFSAGTLGEALQDAAFNDSNLFGFGAADEIKELDAALSGLDPTVAAEAYRIITEEGEKAGLSTKDLVTLFPQYAAGLKLAASEAAAGVGPTDAFTAATQDLSTATGRAEDAAANFQEAIDGLNAALDGRSNMRDYEAATDDFTKSLKDNGHTFDINTEKGRNNQAALDNIASSALDVAANLGEADRKKFLTNAIQDLRTMGENMGLPKREINALIELLRQANNTNVKPSIDVDTSNAMSKLYALQAFKLSDKTIYIHTVRTGGDGDFLSGGVPRASGGPIYGPGTPTSDSIPAMLSTGEYVIKAAAVNHYGLGFFDRANTMRLADGGSADGKDKTTKERAEDAKDRAEERRERKEALRLKKLDNQRLKDLLKSDLRDDDEQRRLELKDARRRLESAQEANRPRSEIREARLAVQQEIADRDEAREQRRGEREAQRQEREEARLAELEQLIDDMLAGQEQAANELISAAEQQKSSWESIRDDLASQMSALGQAATAPFQSSLFGDNNPWANGGGWRDALLNDISGLQEREGLVAQLGASGISADAIGALLEQGSNRDISALIASGGLAEFDSLIQQRVDLTGTVGAAAGQIAYGVEYAQAASQVNVLAEQLALLNARLAEINAMQNPTAAATTAAYSTELAALQDAISNGIVNGGNTVARRGTGVY